MSIELSVELSVEQVETIEASFKIEHLKDNLMLKKLLSDDYDFDLLDDNE